MEQKFKIVGKTNGYIAGRDILFNGKTEITLADNLSLKEAQKWLLEYLNEKFELGMNNWGSATLAVRSLAERAWSNEDGTRGFTYDSRYSSIEEEDEQC